MATTILDQPLEATPVAPGPTRPSSVADPSLAYLRLSLRSYRFLAVSLLLAGAPMLLAIGPRFLRRLVPGSSTSTLLVMQLLLFLVAPTAALALLNGALALRCRLRGSCSWSELLSAVFSAGVGAVMLGYGMFLAHSLFRATGGGRGRQVRRRGRLVLPPVGPAPSWTAVPVDPHVAEDLRSALAMQWRENGRSEHASVAAFSRLTLHLMALGAPLELVEAAHHDGLDEVRHAELCFSLARRIDGLELGPGPFPQPARAPGLPRLRTAALAMLAVDSLLDGALHEGFSARLISRLARGCQDREIAAAQRQIAGDEGRHAAHGWDIVRWCVAAGGRPVLAALEGAVRVLPERVPSSLPEGARDGAWERWGIQGAEIEAAEYVAARADVQRKVRDLAWRAEDGASDRVA